MIRYIGLLTTARCDLHCQHCLQGLPKRKVDFPLELLDKLLIEAMPFGNHHITLTGGEPDLHPHLPALVERIVQYGYTWSLVSHGQRTKVYLPLMERYRNQFKFIRLSLDSASPALHDEIRGSKGAFTNIIQTARTYIDRKFIVWFNTSLNQKNKGEIPQIVDLAKSLGASGIRFGGTIPMQWNQHLVLSDDEASGLYHEIIQLRTNTGVEIRTTSSLYQQGGIDFCSSLAMNTLTVNPQGEIIFCCDTPQREAVIGSLRELTLAELMSEWLEASGRLQTERVRRISTGKMGEGFDTCAFCNNYFSELECFSENSRN
jgi:MoaA/NifB/PqqE/SkfB family radical SAM enzyme